MEITPLNLCPDSLPLFCVYFILLQTDRPVLTDFEIDHTIFDILTKDFSPVLSPQFRVCLLNDLKDESHPQSQRTREHSFLKSLFIFTSESVGGGLDAILESNRRNHPIETNTEQSQLFIRFVCEVSTLANNPIKVILY